MFGDNLAVVTSSTIPHSKLGKRHNALNYHRVREAIAAKMISFHHLSGKVNVADRPTGSPSCVAFCSFGLNWHLLACAGILTFWNIKFIQPPIKPTSRVTFNGQMWGIFIHHLSVEKISLCVQSCLPMFFVYISGLLSVIVMTD